MGGASAAAERHTIASLDVLRGLAILFVVVGHFTPTTTRVELSFMIGLGAAGVVLFFFLSGFLMDLTFAQDGRLGPYLIRRAFRILPMYWVSIAVIFFSEGVWSAKDVIANATFTAPIFGVTRMSGVYWTLYIEVLFYALVPLLFLLGPRMIVAAPCALLAVYALAKIAQAPLSAAPFFLAFCLLGMQFGLWHRRKIDGYVVLLSTAIIICAASTLPDFSPWLGLAPAICAPLLYVAITLNPRQRALEICGHVSYSWYLLHAIVAHAVINVLIVYGWNLWLASLPGVTVAFGCAACTYRIVEQPAISAGKVLIRKLTTSEQGAIRAAITATE
jgi:peptidoglycan/LPS O-acetylase OafA/YrhL